MTAVCRHCHGASGHPVIGSFSSVNAECRVEGLSLALRPAAVCYPCIVRIGREVADDEVRILRRLADFDHEIHVFQRVSVPSCDGCREDMQGQVAA